MAGLAARAAAGNGQMTTPRPTVLLIDDEPHSLSAMRMALEDEFDCLTAEDADSALKRMDEEWVQAVICDQRMPGRTGVDLLTELRERWPEAVRILITGYTDPAAMAQAINDAGIQHFLTKPWHPEQLLVVVRNATQLFQPGARERADGAGDALPCLGLADKAGKAPQRAARGHGVRDAAVQPAQPDAQPDRCRAPLRQLRRARAAPPARPAPAAAGWRGRCISPACARTSRSMR
jgi:CheY-like chemotaxis protein